MRPLARGGSHGHLLPANRPDHFMQSFWGPVIWGTQHELCSSLKQCKAGEIL
jgi:hypothetical protein